MRNGLLLMAKKEPTLTVIATGKDGCGAGIAIYSPSGDTLLDLEGEATVPLYLYDSIPFEVQITVDGLSIFDVQITPKENVNVRDILDWIIHAYVLGPATISFRLTN